MGGVDCAVMIDIVCATTEDAEKLVVVYNLSFYSDFIKYGECPGYNRTIASMIDTIRDNDVYKIMTDGQIVGAISVCKESINHLYLSALCVIPTYANQGIGQQAMKYLDSKYPSAKHWALETPTDKKQNHYFYCKHGYKITREYFVGKVSISYFERCL